MYKDFKKERQQFCNQSIDFHIFDLFLTIKNALRGKKHKCGSKKHAEKHWKKKHYFLDGT